MEITLERVNSDYLFEAKNTQGHRVFLDNRSKKSGVVRGVSPMEVLLMGLAGCIRRINKRNRGLDSLLLNKSRTSYD